MTTRSRPPAGGAPSCTRCWSGRTQQQAASRSDSKAPTAVQAVKRAVRMGEGQPVEQAIAIMMEAHWRSAVHPDRIEGIGAFNEGREPTFQNPDY